MPHAKLLFGRIFVFPFFPEMQLKEHGRVQRIKTSGCGSHSFNPCFSDPNPDAAYALWVGEESERMKRTGAPAALKFLPAGRPAFKELAESLEQTTAGAVLAFELSPDLRSAVELQRRVRSRHCLISHGEK